MNRSWLAGALVGLAVVSGAGGTAASGPAALDEAGGPGPLNVYAETVAPLLRRPASGIPPRVYVPNSGEATVSVVDPLSRPVTARFEVGAVPHHMTPSWDLRRLYVGNTAGNDTRWLYVSDRLMGTISVVDLAARRVVWRQPRHDAGVPRRAGAVGQQPL